MPTKDFDLSAFSVASLGQEPPDYEYWLTKSYSERLEAVEFMRQTMYGYDPATARLQRVLTVAPLSQG